MKFVARSACNEGFVSILTLYHRRTSPEISNRPREFAWELWERHDKHQTQEYPMYALAYCAGKPVGSSVLGVEVERKEKGGSACGVPAYTRDVGMNNPLVNMATFSPFRAPKLSTPPSSTGRQPPEAPLPLTAGRIPPPPGSGAYGKYSSSLRMSSCSRGTIPGERSSPFARFYLFYKIND
ncbi:hypothetical protein ALC53_03814 [Atta colombica]|uniref:Uncharacterized protein n=1 Tax=Atta colombica TaxID=520822 RepID=A0A195BLR1_9HYME|nr:hypothetical protein ALC53_03814 [Atta colombica]